MSETVIELDVSQPWEPPEGPRRRLRWGLPARLVLFTCTLVLTAATLAAGRSPGGLTLLYSIKHGTLNVTVSNGRMFIARYEPSVAGSGIEGRRLSDGALLWSTQASISQQLSVVGDGTVVLVQDNPDDNRVPTSIIVLDPQTGAQRWKRDNVEITGTAGRVLVVEDVQTPRSYNTLPNDLDPAVNHAQPAAPRHYLGIDEVTGGTVWDLTVPRDHVVSIDWSGWANYDLSNFAELSDGGLLTLRDPATGEIRATHQLDWSGRVAYFSAGPRRMAGGATGEQVVLYADGQRGGTVYDFRTGRRVFDWADSPFGNLDPCLPERYCVSTETATLAVDARTGAQVWKLDNFNGITGTAGDRLLATSYEHDPSSTAPRVVVLVDPQDGRVLRELRQWQLLAPLDTGRSLIWHTEGGRDAMLAVFDLETGRLTTVGNVHDWYGDPTCNADGQVLACLSLGVLYVWRLPELG